MKNDDLNKHDPSNLEGGNLINHEKSIISGGEIEKEGEKNEFLGHENLREENFRELKKEENLRELKKEENLREFKKEENFKQKNDSENSKECQNFRERDSSSSNLMSQNEVKNISTKNSLSIPSNNSFRNNFIESPLNTLQDFHSTMHFDPLKGTPANGPFYVDDQVDAFSRRNKIMAFVEKDIFVMNHYESSPFKNRSHAIECILPYHVYAVPADNLKYIGSDVKISLIEEMEKLNNHIKRAMKIVNMKKDSEKNEISPTTQTDSPKQGFTPQLLLFHEQRYLHTRLEKRAKKEPRIKGKGKKGFFIRIQKSFNLHVYGYPWKIILRTKKIKK